MGAGAEIPASTEGRFNNSTASGYATAAAAVMADLQGPTSSHGI